MISLTEKAVIKIREISEEQSIGHCTIRLQVKGGGCSGFTYDICFEDIVSDMDEIIDQNDIKIVIDPLSFQYLDNVEVDYVDGMMGAGFRFINPNVKGTCGCGSSVSF